MCTLVEEFINISSKNVYSAINKHSKVFPMRPLIYDPSFKMDEEPTQDITRLYFLTFLSTYYMKLSLFSMASSIGKPLT